MSSLRIIAVVVAAFAALAASLGYVYLESDPLPEPVKILFVADPADEQHELLVSGALAAAHEHRLELEVAQSIVQPNAPAGRPISVGKTPRFDGLVIAASVEPSPTPSPGGAEPRKIVTVGNVRDVPTSLVHVEACAYQLGHSLAQAAYEALPTGGTLVLLIDAQGDEVQSHRVAGFRAAIEHAAEGRTPTYQLLECETLAAPSASVLRATARSNVACCIVDFTNRPATDLVEEAGVALSGDPKLITTDQSAAALAALEGGSIDAIVAHDFYAYGYHAVVRIASLCRSTPLELPIPGRGSMSVPPIRLRRDNVAQFRAKLHPTSRVPAA